MSAVLWWPHTDNPAVASFRLRCQNIIDALRAQGMDAGLFHPEHPHAKAPAVLVLGKRYDIATLATAVSLRRSAGTRIVLDLCDNHFHVNNGENALLDRAQQLRQAIRDVDLVIVASEALADAVADECGRDIPIVVIPDAIETPIEPAGLDRLKSPKAEWEYCRLAYALRASGVPRSRRLLWFGNHGSPGVDGGMGDLASIRGYVEQAHRRSPVSLTVVSNNHGKFLNLVEPWAVATHYVAWNAHTFSRVARLHGMAVVPISLNPFTRCKTNNRVATAFEHGMSVAADAIPSYVEFSGCAVLNDWPLAMGDYLDDSVRRAADIEKGARLLSERYSIATVSAQWRKALDAPDSAGGFS